MPFLYVITIQRGDGYLHFIESELTIKSVDGNIIANDCTCTAIDEIAVGIFMQAGHYQVVSTACPIFAVACVADGNNGITLECHIVRDVRKYAFYRQFLFFAFVLAPMYRLSYRIFTSEDLSCQSFGKENGTSCTKFKGIAFQQWYSHCLEKQGVGGDDMGSIFFLTMI